jgi:hypothetical protein
VANGGTGNGLERFLGGSPGAVLMRLVLMSLLLGAVMWALGLSPVGLVHGIFDFARGMFELAAESLGTVVTWLITGAVIVVPLFLLSRLFRR